MKHIINFAVEEDVFRDIVVKKPEAGIAEQVCNVGSIAGNQIIDANNGMSLGEQSVAEMRSEKAGAPRYDGGAL
jgi:hypothetical protein